MINLLPANAQGWSYLEGRMMQAPKGGLDCIPIRIPRLAFANASNSDRRYRPDHTKGTGQPMIIEEFQPKSYFISL